MPKIGDIVDGKMWNGKQWLVANPNAKYGWELEQPAKATGPAPTIPKVGGNVGYPYPGDVEVKQRMGTGTNKKTPDYSQLALGMNAQLADFENAQSSQYQNSYVPKKTTSENTSGGGSGGGNYAPMGYIPPEKMSGAQLAAMFGITQDRGEIEKILNDATKVKFNELDAQTRKLRDQQLTDYSSQFDQYQQYARQGRANALKSGLSRGTAVAQDIMSQMNAQKGGAENQAFYQQGLADLVNQRGTQLGADKYNALSMSNELGMGLGNLSSGFYQSDVAGLTGYQQYLASLANANAMQAQAGASRYAADRGYAASTEQGNALVDLINKLGLPDYLKADVMSGELSAEEAMNLFRSSQPKPKPVTTPGGYTDSLGRTVG